MYPNTKFVSIIGDQCIPNYPDKNLPTLLIYRAGELRRQIVGLRPEIGLDEMNTKLQGMLNVLTLDIELLLAATGAIVMRQPPNKTNKESEVHEKEINGSIRNSTRKTQEDEDDELDWD